tara:strand:+ start:9371 stop:10750 length:1380 start_codon:yes stop_codon:yes gene_type:complete
MIIHIFFLFLSLLSLSLRADVDLKNGNFFYSWIDADLSSKNFFWQLQRTYNSRVNRVGYFGQGWCSPLETKLTRSAELKKTIEIQNCGSGESIIYQPDGIEWRSGDQVISMNEEFYILKVKGVTQLQFNKNGTLDAFWLRDEKAKLKYQDDRLNRLETLAGNFNFVFDEDGKVIEINSNAGSSVKYSYSGTDLVSVTNAWGNQFSYQYDKFGNMTLAKWPDKSFLKLKYDTRRDWITSLTDRDGCAEHYEYDSKKIKEGLKITSTVLRTCKKKTFDKKTMEIVFDNQNNLKNVKKSIGKSWKQVEYNSLGKPKKISDNFGLAQVFDYDKNGNLILKQNGSEKTQFVLNEKSQITQVNSEKVKLNLDYDDRGRPSRIIASYDATSKELAISYIDTTEKLKTLELKGSGRIDYRYDNEGAVSDTTVKAIKTSEQELKANVNRVYGIYTTLTDEAAIFGGLD